MLNHFFFQFSTQMPQTRPASASATFAFATLLAMLSTTPTDSSRRTTTASFMTSRACSIPAATSSCSPCGPKARTRCGGRVRTVAFCSRVTVQRLILFSLTFSLSLSSPDPLFPSADYRGAQSALHRGHQLSQEHGLPGCHAQGSRPDRRCQRPLSRQRKPVCRRTDGRTD